MDLPPLRTDPGAQAEAATRLSAMGLQERPFAILGPGAAYGPAKRWGAERFAALGRGLLARGLGLLTCGTAAEREVCAAVAAAAGAGARSLAGETGLAHLAAATGIPTVVVFGSTSSAWTAPLGPRVRVVQRAPVCSPCFARTCAIGYACLDAVGVALVAGAAREVAA